MAVTSDLAIRRDNNLTFRQDCLGVLNKLEQRISTCFKRITSYNFYMKHVVEIEEEFVKISTMLYVIDEMILNHRRWFSENADILSYSQSLTGRLEKLKTEVKTSSFVKSQNTPLIKKVLPLVVGGILFVFFYSFFSKQEQKVNF